jgi:hypothetical protein
MKRLGEMKKLRELKRLSRRDRWADLKIGDAQFPEQ